MEFILKVIFIFFLISFLGRLFFRYVLPWWLARFIKKRQKEYGDRFGYTEQRVNDEEKIHYKENSTQSKINPNVGEYVDFEEIDDNE